MLIINNKNNNFPIEIRDYEAYPIDNERFSFEKKDLRQKSIIKKTNTQTDTQNISNDIEKTEKPKIGISLIKKINTQTDAQNTPNDIEYQDEIIISTTPNKVIDISGLQKIIEHKMCIDNVVNRDIMNYDW